MAPHAGAVLASLTFAWPSAIDDTAAAHQLLCAIETIAPAFDNTAAELALDFIAEALNLADEDVVEALLSTAAAVVWAGMTNRPSVAQIMALAARGPPSLEMLRLLARIVGFEPTFALQFAPIVKWPLEKMLRLTSPQPL
jgi:hypothetical protein